MKKFDRRDAPCRLTQTYVPDDEFEPISHHRFPLLFNFHRQFAATLLFTIVDESLYPNERPEALQVSPIAARLQVVLEEHDVHQVLRPEVETQFLVFDGYAVLVVVYVEVVVVTEPVLHPQRKRIEDEVVLYADLRLEYVFHHFVDYVGLDELEDAVRQILRLLPHGRRHEHLALRVPIHTDVLDLLQLDDRARVSVQKRVG